ncbi:hypothetical protein [Flavobacterium denitrificans]|uniref:hypothetical protein n=1 Tax=Flavobacterium denitrificans TaxID=281361 RepID=UPI000420C82F|nr:hypothetical protein [Flavobacterium denitrificans]
MKNLSFILAVICLTFVSCNNDDDNAKEKDARKLEKMHKEIVVLSQVNTTPCTDASEWAFTAIGSKACGGPMGFILYSKKIDTVKFLAKVKAYTDAEAAFNVKWNISSPCDMAIPPTGVDCVNGKPTLLYNAAFKTQ